MHQVKKPNETGTKKSKNRTLMSSAASAKMLPIVRLWCLRTLVLLEAHRNFIEPDSFSISGVEDELGVDYFPKENGAEFSTREALAAVKKAHARAEKTRSDKDLPVKLQKNIKRFNTTLQLDEASLNILILAVMAATNRALAGMLKLIPVKSHFDVFRSLAVILGLSVKQVTIALNAKSLLQKSGLVNIQTGYTDNLNDAFELFSNGFADEMLEGTGDLESVLAAFIQLSGEGHLADESYAHISPSVDFINKFLAKAVEDRRCGVNILLHGVPGTGKTQLAKLLAKKLKRKLYEIASETENGDAIKGRHRMKAYTIAQSVFAKAKPIVLFDEVEDIFGNDDNVFQIRDTEQPSKAWVNRVLEENPVPAIWITNSIFAIDPAYIRRFDIVVDLKIPPMKQREAIIDKNCGHIVSKRVVEQLTRIEALSPAIIARASSVVGSVFKQMSTSDADKALQSLVLNTLKAQGIENLPRALPDTLPDIYDPAFITVDVDLERIAVGLAKTKSGRLCLFGPPGTGKTAYCKWLASQLGLPLQVKRTSDILSKYVGENEQNIAQAFEDAKSAGAVLLIDEVDSLLSDRRGSENSWERRMVNELLTQMECFEGIFIASTNLMDGLDQAALRRFDLKLKFDFLMADQAIKLFGRHNDLFGFTRPTENQINRLRRMERLTPGDFAVILRQHRLGRISDPEEMLTALECECALKDGAKARIGFI